MKKFDYFKPKTLKEALTLFAKYGEKAKWIAGGTDVIVMIKQETMGPDVLISLRGIPGLDEIKFNGSLSLGPMVTH
ncbi:MAG TPA: FAD binding domain-containing protein, partial [Thermodesulfobacteriota bacterium]|nr:FAD binding domain-containing protein [Thermodesulfobacteriota bacterium]